MWIQVPPQRLVELARIQGRNRKVRLSGFGRIGQRVHQSWRNHHHQLSRCVVDVLRFEERSQNWNVGGARRLAHDVRGPLVQQARYGKALIAAQLNLGLRPARGQCGDRISVDRNCIGIVQRTYFGRHFQSNRSILVHGGCELQFHAILPERDRNHRPAAIGAGLEHGKGELAAGEKVRRLAADGRDRGFGQDLQHLFAFQVLHRRAQVQFRAVQQKIQRVGGRQHAAGCAIRAIRRGRGVLRCGCGRKEARVAARVE